MVMSGVFIVSFGTQSAILNGQTNAEATTIAQQLLEQQQANAKQDFTTVVGSAGSVPPYTTSVTVTPSGDGLTKLITALVSWLGDHGQALSVKLTTLVTDPQSASAGDTCNAVLSGDWTHPQDWKGGYGYGDFSSPAGTSGLDSFNHKVYLTSDTTNKPDFYIFDVSNPKPAGLNLPLLGSTQTGYGLMDVRVSGKYAYVAVHSTSVADPQLIVIDISDASNPTVVAHLRTSGGTSATYASTITYYKQKIYLGLTKNTGKEVRVIDVSNPLLPVEVGTGFETNTKVNQIVIKDDVMYIASALNNQAYIVDISDPLNPVQSNPVVQTFVDPSGTQEWSGQTVAFFGTKLYVGRIRDIGNSALTDMYILNANDLSAAPLGQLTQTKNDGPTRVVFRSNLIFMTNASPNDGFQIWDVSNPGSLVRYDTSPVNIQQTSTAGMDCDGNLIYVGQRSNHALQIIGPSLIDPSSMQIFPHDTSHNVVATVPLNSSVHAAATLTGSAGVPSGTVAFTFYTNGTCSVGATSAGTVTLVTGVADPSTTEGPLSSAGTYSFKAHYSGDSKYNPFDSSCVSLTVTKADQTITVTTHAPATAAYNSTFTVAATASSGLPVTITTSGVCTIAGNTVTMTSGTGTCTVKYDQGGNANYNAAPQVVENTTATKATPVVTWANPADITYGTALGGTQLNATSGGVAGTFTYTPPAGTVLNAGANQVLSVHFAPSAPANYNTPADKTVLINVNKATPVISWANPAAITYGTTLGAAQLNATSGGVAGTFTYTPPAGTVLNAGANQILSEHFAPSDAANYNTPADKTVTVTVNKAIPSFTVTIKPSTSVTAGTVVHDEMQLFKTGNGVLPAGSVTFTLFKNGNCGGGTNQISSGVINAGGLALSQNWTTASADKPKMSYQTQFPGDSNYTAVAGACQALSIN